MSQPERPSKMVTSKDLAKGNVVVKPRRKSSAPAVLMLFFVLILAGSLTLAWLGFTAPAKLAIPQEQILGLLHGGVADTYEETYVDACVRIEGADGPRAITRSRRVITFGDGTTIQVVFSGVPTLTNACP